MMYRCPYNVAISCELTSSCLGCQFCKPIEITDSKEITLQKIDQAVKYVFAHNKLRIYCTPRQVAMYFASEKTKVHLTKIASYYGLKNHATVIHATRTISDLCKFDKELKEKVDKINELLCK